MSQNLNILYDERKNVTTHYLMHGLTLPLVSHEALTRCQKKKNTLGFDALDDAKLNVVVLVSQYTCINLIIKVSFHNNFSLVSSPM